MTEKILAYTRFCPNCGGIIYDDRLKQSLVCPNCLEQINSIEKTADYLINLPQWYFLFDNIKEGNLKEYKTFFDKVLDFINFFEKISDKIPWSLQISWTKRVFLKESFSIIAPTGVGKTTWGLAIGLYLYLNPLFKKQNKIYYVLPTTLLTIHTFERFQKLLEKFCEVFGICKKKMYEEVLLYHGNLTTKQKKEIKEKIKIGQFKILFTTTNFLYRNFEVLEPNIGKFQFIFVDDVDSLLKTAKNIDYILRLMGFSEDAIQLALEIVKLKVQLPFLKGSKLEETLDKLNKLRQKLAKYKEKIKTILVASSATAKPKGIKIKILGELLDFEVGKTSSNLRNVVDTYINRQENLNIVEGNFGIFLKIYEDKFVKLLDLLKDGIFCFIPADWGKEEVYKVKDYLTQHRIQAETYEKIDDDVIAQFKEGKIQVLIGIASYRNPLARGIDLPDAAKFALFLGVPKFIFDANIAYNPRGLISVILNLTKILPDKIKQDLNWDTIISQYLKFLNKISNYTKDYILNNDFIKQRLEEIYGFVNNLIKQPEIKNLLLKAEDIAFDGQHFIIADIAAYLQASGRVSRMYVGGLTKGLATIFVDNQKAFNNLQKRIKWFYDDLNFVKLNI